SLRKFNSGQFEFDPMIDAEDDQRYGMTLLARPADKVKQRLSEIFQKIKSVAPKQYYYPLSDLHLTVLPIISCYQGFSLRQVNTDDYIAIVASAIQSISPFNICFKGITASPSCILIQGFPEDEQLNELRNNLRNQFRQTNLHHLIDRKYKLQTAHLTAIRFRQPLNQPKRFVKKLKNLRDTDFGDTMVSMLELAGNDWYQRQENSQSIYEYSLA
ncbi:MAG TPA: 2'-5' RNA ligase family protein, partial [Balneolaceae bacterium]|nr:2'-5' RNA ligase family protein [Balneolaceae bacterium]